MIGKEIHDLAHRLWPMNRSITGIGVRETLEVIGEYLPGLKIGSIATGTKAFDWKIPEEWIVHEAYILTPDGEKICDYSLNNLHLVGYSKPFRGEMSLSELKTYLHTLPDQPEAIPYITSFYEKIWGFCISHQDFVALKDGNYTVVINSEHYVGELNYGELIIHGETDNEILLSSYVCHPSMANNELSGPTTLTYLAKWLQGLDACHYTYRILFVPETIGSIAYLSLNLDQMKKNVVAGFNITCVGDDRAYSYLPSRNGKTISDKIAKHVLKWTDSKYVSYTWFDRGSDERQYCAPGIDLPIASIMRTKFGNYPEYHTSLDNLKTVVTPEGLNGGYWVHRKALEIMEKNHYLKTSMLCEPQMGKRGLYPNLSIKESCKSTRLMMDLLSQSDGSQSILDIAEMLNVPIWSLYDIVDTLHSFNLIERSWHSKI